MQRKKTGKTKLRNKSKDSFDLHFDNVKGRAFVTMGPDPVYEWTSVAVFEFEEYIFVAEKGYLYLYEKKSGKLEIFPADKLIRIELDGIEEAKTIGIAPGQDGTDTSSDDSGSDGPGGGGSSPVDNETDGEIGEGGRHGKGT